VFTQSNAAPGDTVLMEGPDPISILIAAVVDSLGANVVISGIDRDTAYRLPLLDDLGVETINAHSANLADYA